MAFGENYSAQEWNEKLKNSDSGNQKDSGEYPVPVGAEILSSIEKIDIALGRNKKEETKGIFTVGGKIID